jgi:hypothetical protein
MKRVRDFFENYWSVKKPKLPEKQLGDALFLNKGYFLSFILRFSIKDIISLSLVNKEFRWWFIFFLGKGEFSKILIDRCRPILLVYMGNDSILETFDALSALDVSLLWVYSQLTKHVYIIDGGRCEKKLLFSENNIYSIDTRDFTNILNNDYGNVQRRCIIEYGIYIYTVNQKIQFFSIINKENGVRVTISRTTFPHKIDFIYNGTYRTILYGYESIKFKTEEGRRIAKRIKIGTDTQHINEKLFFGELFKTRSFNTAYIQNLYTIKIASVKRNHRTNVIVKPFIDNPEKREYQKTMNGDYIQDTLSTDLFSKDLSDLIANHQCLNNRKNAEFVPLFKNKVLYSDFACKSCYNIMKKENILGWNNFIYCGLGIEYCSMEKEILSVHNLMFKRKYYPL